MLEMVDDDLVVETPEGPLLNGGRCTGCAAYTFPRQSSCPRCSLSTVEAVILGRTGTLWSFTVQAFTPKSPYNGSADFEPFGVGYIDLPGELIVQARLTESDPARLSIGMPMVLTLAPYGYRGDGSTVFTYAFAPVEEG